MKLVKKNIHARISGLLLTAALFCYAAPASSTTKFRLNLPAQTLDKDIRDLARNANITISYSRRALKKYNRSALNGQFTAKETLKILLEGTEYSYEFVNDKTVRIYKIKRKKNRKKPFKKSKRTSPVLVPTNLLERPAPAAPIGFEPDEIIVTANKRNRFQVLQIAPYSASVVSAKALEALGVTDTESLSLHIAGVEMTNLGSSRNKMSIRGLSDGAFNGRVQSTVGIYFNETPINFNAPYPEIPLLDISSIEVLRGPQGSLYGAGSIGGVYKITTREPDLRQTGGWVGAGLSSIAKGSVNADLTAMYNVPIVEDKLGVRAVGYWIENGGYIDNIRLGLNDVNRTKIAGGRLNGKWHVSPDWTVVAGGTYQDVVTNDTQYAQESLPGLSRDTFIQEPHRDDFLHLYVNVTGDLQWGHIKSTTSFTGRDILDVFDASLSLPQNFNIAVEPTSYQEERSIDFISHETYVNLDVSDALDVLIGGFITHTTNDYQSNFNILSTANSQSLYRELRNDISIHYGVFGEVDYQVTDALSLSVGLRWFDEHLTTETHIFDLNEPDNFIRGEKTDNDMLPRINLGYQFTDDAYLYALASVGYRVGGLNTGNAVNSILPNPTPGDDDGDDDSISVFESDIIYMYELGGKTQWLGDKLVINASAFFVDWRNIQTEHILNEGFSIVLNAGDATNLGYDFELIYHPTPNIDIQGNLTINNPDLKNINPVLGVGADEKHLPRVPELSGGFVLTYRKKISEEWNSSWSLDYAYTGSSQLSFASTDNISMGNNHALNARVNVSNAEWQLEGFINNILDDKSNTFAFGNPFTFRTQKHLTPQRPRTVGVRMRKRF